jgi:cell division protein ZapE
VELLCFDEFHVHDIADAFLMGRFLDTAIGLGTRIVLTSNYAPDALLSDPEFHERFLPTIEQIKRCFTVIHFDGARDYRFGTEEAALRHFFAPLDAATRDALLPPSAQQAGRSLHVPRAQPCYGRTSRTCVWRAVRTLITWRWPSNGTV